VPSSTSAHRSANFLTSSKVIANPHPCATASPLSLEEPRSGVSKDGRIGASWFETALARLLTMRFWLMHRGEKSRHSKT
jgi:hypothetical protein